jgi:hypothetical protein
VQPEPPLIASSFHDHVRTVYYVWIGLGGTILWVLTWAWRLSLRLDRLERSSSITDRAIEKVNGDLVGIGRIGSALGVIEAKLGTLAGEIAALRADVRVDVGHLRQEAALHGSEIGQLRGRLDSAVGMLARALEDGHKDRRRG